MPKLSKLDERRKTSATEANRRRTFALAQLHELKLAERRGALVDLASVESAWAAAGVQIRDAVMALKERIANRCPAEWRPKLAPVIDDEVRQVLTALSGRLRADPSAEAKQRGKV
jgi:phage terminase Nu1 subunit (DNA packaging protein)